jgi:hypothetical protein
VAGACILLLVYTVGFPCFCFVLLMRAFSEHHSKGVLGWLRRKVPILRGRKKRRLHSLVVQQVPDTLASPHPRGSPRVQDSSVLLTSPVSSNAISTAWSADTSRPVKGAFAPSGQRATGWAIDAAHWELNNTVPMSPSAAAHVRSPSAEASDAAVPSSSAGGKHVTTIASTSAAVASSSTALNESKDSAAPSLYGSILAAAPDVEPTAAQLQAEREAEYGESEAET